MELEARIMELDAQSSRLKSELAAALKGEDAGELAREVHEGFLSGDRIRIMRASRNLELLDERATPVFLAAYREQREDSDRRYWALWCALCCGGPDVAPVLNEILSDPTHQDRKGLLEAFWDPDPDLSASRIPLSTELAQTVFRLVRSPHDPDRLAAAFLLGGSSDTSAACVVLQDLAERDPDKEVRSHAIKSLGLVGDRATLAYLEGFAANHPAEAKEDGVLSGELKMAIRSLRKKFGE